MHGKKGWLLVATLAGAACSSSSNRPGDIGSGTPTDDAGSTGDGGNPAGQDASSHPGQDGAADDGGPAGDAQGGGGEGGSTDGGEGGVPPGAPVCDPTHVWTAKQGVDPSVPSTDFLQFGAVSRDELAIAWTTPSATIQVADRAARNMPFAAPVTVTAGSTPLAVDRVALDWTGTLLLAVSSDRSKLIELTRQAGQTTWTVSDPADLVNINAMGTNGGGGFSEPVLGMDGNTLFFLWTPPNQPPELIASTWNAQQKVWSLGVTPSNSELSSMDSTHRRRPTGVSSDGRTLFFYDEEQGQERAAWRDSITSPFTSFTDVGAIPEAAPNDLCNRLYFQGVDPEGGGAGLGFAY